MTSNVVGIAGAKAGSYRAAEAAMKLAGIRADSSVVFTGYSQGGLVAAQLAASGDYRTAGLFTLGAPAGQVAVPKAVPYVAIEHTEDIVPAVGGTWASSAPVLVRRSVFGGKPANSTLVFPAHQLSQYRASAALLDRSDDQRVAAALGALDEGSRARRHRRVDVLPRHAGDSARLAVAPADDRAQEDADEPADERQHHRAEHAPPEVVDVQAEPEQGRNPADQQQQAGSSRRAR